MESRLPALPCRSWQAAFWLAFLLWTSAASAQTTFHLHAPGLADTVEVFIAGSSPALGNWNPGAVRLQRQGPQDWTITIPEPGIGLEYKYTLGTWQREGLGPDGKVRGNFRVPAGSPTVVHDTITQWLSGQRPAPQGQVTGTVHRLHDLRPEGLAARDVVVWLPPGYDAATRNRYPVLYMHDGQNVFDPATSSFGVDWQVDETCDSLIRHHKLPPMIVVGVYNSSDRSAEYSPGPKGEAYMHFLIHQLKPLIDSSYRTRPDRKHTFVGGSSMGGLISFMLTWEHPEVFSKAICMSPAFQYKGFDYVPKVSGHQGRLPKAQFYLDNGGLGLELVLQPGCDAMRQALQAKGYREGRDYFWVLDPAAEHNEAAWARRLPDALQMLLGK